MKISYGPLAACALFLVLVAQREYGPQLAILGLSLAIFFGTLSSRKPAPGDATGTHPGHG
jgi:hypothetical protein